MKAIFGDLHLNRKAENPIVRKHIKQGQIDFFNNIKLELEKNNVDTIFFTGDIFDTRNTVNVEALIIAKQMLSETFRDFKKHIILGNHDLYYENSYDVSALSLYENIDNLTLHLNKVVKEEINGYTWYFVPWILENNKESFISFLKKLAKKTKEEKDKTIIFGHFEMLGVDMEGGNISMDGLDSNLFLDAAKLTISGHYHGKSLHEKLGNRIIYVGSPYPLTFANSDQDHGIWLMDDELNLNFIKNQTSPTFKTLHDTKIKDSDIEDLNNSFVRFYFDRDTSPEDLAVLKMKIESKKPILILPNPYKSLNETELNLCESEGDNANEYLNMDISKLTGKYLEINTENIPSTKYYDNPKKFILGKIDSYSEEIIK